LIIDDEPDVTAYLTAFFEDNGFRILSASNGKEGFEVAKSEKPDLITLDITMPEESGVRLYRDLQANEATSAIPVIMVTGVSHEFKRFIETRRQVQAPAGYFEKPIDRDALLAKVNELLSIKPN
jgi:DNA-binding response OmpR family regulator